MACPPSAFALRSINLHENAGTEEEVRSALAGTEEAITAQRVAWDVVPEYGIFIVPDPLLALLVPSARGEAEGVTVGKISDEFRNQLENELWGKMLVAFPAFAGMTTPQVEELLRRILTPSHILIRRSVRSDHVQEVLEHELMQRYEYPYEALLEKGVRAIHRSGWGGLFSLLSATPYQGRLTTIEFWAQWFRPGPFDTEEFEQAWLKQRADLKAAARDPRRRRTLDPDLLAALDLIENRLGPRVQKEVQGFIYRVKKGLEDPPLISLPDLQVMSAIPPLPLSPRPARRVSDNPDFIRQIIKSMMASLSDQLKVTPGQFQRWLTDKSILILGEDEYSELKRQLEEGGAQGIQTLPRGSLGKSWAKHHSRYDMIFSILALNSTRVPAEMTEREFWDHVAREHAFALKPDGLSVLVFGASGNEPLHDALSQRNFELDILPRRDEMGELPSRGLYIVVRKGRARSVEALFVHIRQEIAAPAQLEEKIQSVLAGTEQPPLILTRVSNGSLIEELGQWLEEQPEIRERTEHYGTARIVFRMLDQGSPDFPPLVTAIALQDWVNRYPVLDETLAEPFTWGSHGHLGRGLVDFYLDHYRSKEGQDAIVIERVQIYRETRQVSHHQEFEIRPDFINAVGEFGRTREPPVSVYLMGPRGIVLARSGLKAKTGLIYDNYVKPVDKENRDFWRPVPLLIKGSRAVAPEEVTEWFQYAPPAAGVEQPNLAGVSASWEQVAATPPAETGQKRLLPIFYDAGTFHVLPLMVRGKIAFVVVVEPDEEQMVRDLLNAVRAPESQYRLVVSQDKVAGIGKAQDEYAQRYRVHLVNKDRKNWLGELLAGLEQEGVIPIGDLEGALQVTETYTSRFM